MRYFVNNNEVDEIDFKDQLEDAIRDYVTKNFDDIIDDIEPEVKIFNMIFSPSEVLKKVDPIAYKYAMDDEVSFEFDDAWYEFEDSDHEDLINDIEFKSEADSDEV